MKVDLYSRYPVLEKCKTEIEHALEMLKNAYSSGGTIYVCGNGGSAADSDHIVGELMKGFLERRMISDDLQEKIREKFPSDASKFISCLQTGIPAISLCSFNALSTAYSNDVDADMLYAQMVMTLAKKDDILLAISTSGNSKNVVNALKMSSVLNVKSIGLTGEKNCAFDNLCDEVIHAPETETFKIQELHLPIYHYLCAMLEDFAVEK